MFCLKRRFKGSSLFVEKAPWWDGFYERLLQSVRTPLKKLFAKAMLDAEQLTTVLAEIEAQLNSRPLTYLGADPDDYSVITPAQILIGRNLQACPTKETRFRTDVKSPHQTFSVSSEACEWILEAVACRVYEIPDTSQEMLYDWS